MQKIPYTITNESITVILGQDAHTVQRDNLNFLPLCTAVLAGQWDKVPDLLTLRKAISNWSSGKFQAKGDQIYYGEDLVPAELSSRMFAMLTKGESPDPLTKFWERLQLNPSARSVEQLYSFLQHTGIPIGEDGFILAYKGVTADYKDCHTKTIDNHPGAKIERLPRNKISDDPRTACHYGYHVGAKKYAEEFGVRVVICKVDPADVVCVPYDADAMKMRVCWYQPLGNMGGKMPDTVLPNSDLPAATEKSVGPKDDDLYKDPLAAAHAVGEDFDDLDDDDFEDDDDDDVPEDDDDDVGDFRNDRYTDLSTLDEEGLLGISLEDLRKFASGDMQIVGASKILGGKAALVKRILEVRNGTKKQ